MYPKWTFCPVNLLEHYRPPIPPQGVQQYASTFVGANYLRQKARTVRGQRVRVSGSRAFRLFLYVPFVKQSDILSLPTCLQ